jgi:hypothetical protein
MRKLAMIVGMVWALALSLALPSAPAAARPPFFQIMARANGTRAQFTYLDSLSLSGLSAGWTPGDRVAYRCAYAFLQVRGRLVARVTFTRIEYAMLNDKYMNEGVRYYDGTLNTGTAHQLNDCPGPSEPYVDVTGPLIGPVPVVTFSEASTGAILEVRDFSAVTQVVTQVIGAVPWQFRVVKATPDRVSIVGYQAGSPALAIYYDRLSPSIRLTSNARP